MSKSTKRKPRKTVVQEMPDERSDIGTYFHSTRSREHNTSLRSSKMATSRSRSGHEIQQSQRTSRSPNKAIQSQDRDSTESGSEDDHLGIDNRLEKYLSALPTKGDMESMFRQMEDSHRRDMAELNKHLQNFNDRVDAVEQIIPPVITGYSEVQVALTEHHVQLQNLWSHMDDMEDRHRRNNIRLRGIPEAIGHQDLLPLVKATFNSLLDKPATEHIEIDRVHRTPGALNPAITQPRDVICRVHFYKCKEELMLKARNHGPIESNGAQITLYSDLSRRTLAKRRSLRPLTRALVEAGITYNWRYPFHLLARKNGRAYIFRLPSDLPAFTKNLGIPQVELEQWPDPPMPRFSEMPLWEPWIPVKSPKQRLNQQTI